MSFDLGAALRAELAKPEVQAQIAAFKSEAVGAVEFIEGLALRVAEGALEQMLPAILRPLVLPIVQPLLNEINQGAEDFTVKELRKLFAVSSQATFGVRTFSLTVAKVFPAGLPQGPDETEGDWPTERNK